MMDIVGSIVASFYITVIAMSWFGITWEDIINDA